MHGANRLLHRKRALINLDIPGLDDEVDVPILSPLVDPLLRVGPPSGASTSQQQQQPTTPAPQPTTQQQPAPQPTTQPPAQTTPTPTSGNGGNSGGGNSGGNNNNNGGNSGNSGGNNGGDSGSGNGNNGSDNNGSGSGNGSNSEDSSSGNANNDSPSSSSAGNANDGSATPTTGGNSAPASSSNSGSDSDAQDDDSSDSADSSIRPAGNDFSANPTSLVAPNAVGNDPSDITVISSDGVAVSTQTQTRSRITVGSQTLTLEDGSTITVRNGDAFTFTRSDGSVATSTASSAPTTGAAADTNGGSGGGLSGGAIGGIVVGLLLLLLFLLMLMRKRHMLKRSERRNMWWFGRRRSSGLEWVDVPTPPSGGADGTRSARSSFGTSFDHSHTSPSRYSPDLVEVPPVPVPSPPPMVEIRDTHNPHTATSPIVSSVRGPKTPLLISVDSPSTAERPNYFVVDSADHRLSVHSNRTTSSDPYSQHLVVTRTEFEKDLPTPMSVRPFSPTESWSFPKPPKEQQGNSDRLSVQRTLSDKSDKSYHTAEQQQHAAAAEQNPFASPNDANPFLDPSPEPSSTRPDSFTSIETVNRPFAPTLHDELPVDPGDKVRISRVYDDGWALVSKVEGKGKGKQVQGLIPIDCFREAGQDLPAFLAKRRVSSYAGVNIDTGYAM